VGPPACCASAKATRNGAEERRPPGVIAGMMVSGLSPVYAGILQCIVVAIILAVSGITRSISTLLSRKRASLQRRNWRCAQNAWPAAR
jgi:Uncharacterised protein family (UPF0014)